MALKEIITDEPYIPERAKYLFEQGFVPEIVAMCIGFKIKPYLLMIMRRSMINRQHQQLCSNKKTSSYHRDIETHVRARTLENILKTKSDQYHATAYLHYYMLGEAREKLLDKACLWADIDDVIDAYNLFDQQVYLSTGKCSCININDAWSLSQNLHQQELALMQCRDCAKWYTTICAEGVNDKSIEKITACPFC